MKLFTSDENIPKLNEFDQILCDEEINIEECTLALKNFSNNRWEVTVSPQTSIIFSGQTLKLFYMTVLNIATIT